MRFFKKLFIFIILIFSSMNFAFANEIRKDGKIILIGDGGSGKTAFIDALIRKKIADEFTKPSDKIAATENHIISLEKENDKIIVNFEIQDYPGQEQFRSAVKSYFRGAHIAFVFVSLIDDKLNGTHLNDWIKDAILQSENENLVVVVFETFIDKEDEYNHIDPSRFERNRRLIQTIMSDFKKGHSVLGPYEISNKQPIDVTDTVNRILKEKCYDIIENSLKNQSCREPHIVLKIEDNKEKKSSCC